MQSSVADAVTADNAAVKTSSNESYCIFQRRQEQEDHYEMIDMTRPLPINSQYSVIDVGHRPCLPLPVGPPTVRPTQHRMRNLSMKQCVVRISDPYVSCELT